MPENVDKTGKIFKSTKNTHFMAEKLLSDAPDNADVLLLGIEYDRTSSFGKGSDKGPKKIIDCFNAQLELYERNAGWSPARHLKISSAVLSDLKNKEPELMAKEVSSEYLKKIKEHKFIVSLGGEHSITAGILDAWSKSKPANKVTVLQVDAHLDLRDDDSDYSMEPSRFAHSCVMKRALDMGYKMVSVGIRAYADFELKTAKANRVRIFEWPCSESNALIREIISSIKTNDVYISLDADGIDPAHMPATGTPVQGGLSWKFAFDLLRELFKRKNVIGTDIVEVAPRPYDQLTEFGAAQLCYFMIAMKFKNHNKQR